MEAVFKLRVNQHLHVQCQEVLQAPGMSKTHWEQLEFWPLQVCHPSMYMYA